MEYVSLVLWIIIRLSYAQIIEEEINADNAALSSNENSPNHLSETIPGTSNEDYPTYSRIPRTKFSCRDKINWQYYADVETDCQVFHICITNFQKMSFLCPVGSIFNQMYLVCDWWYNVDCSSTLLFYTLTNGFNDQDFSEEVIRDQNGLDLSPASSGRNVGPPTDFSTTPANTSFSDIKERDQVLHKLKPGRKGIKGVL